VTLESKLQEIRRWHMFTTTTDEHGECNAEGGECSLCGILDCPYDDPLHYHHDACPSEYANEPADPDTDAASFAKQQAADAKRTREAGRP
jgi:hypothetical protein